jgi:hypothetical protein
MTDREQRLTDEKNELDYKVKKLVEFCSGPVFEQLDDKNRELLKDQLAAMRVYSFILGERLDLFRKD